MSSCDSLVSICQSAGGTPSTPPSMKGAKPAPMATASSPEPEPEPGGPVPVPSEPPLSLDDAPELPSLEEPELDPEPEELLDEPDLLLLDRNSLSVAVVSLGSPSEPVVTKTVKLSLPDELLGVSPLEYDSVNPGSVGCEPPPGLEPPPGPEPPGSEPPEPDPPTPELPPGPDEPPGPLAPPLEPPGSLPEGVVYDSGLVSVGMLDAIDDAFELSVLDGSEDDGVGVE